jgi:hypothetical protein
LVKTTGPALGRGAIEPIDVALFSQRSSHDADRVLCHGRRDGRTFLVDVRRLSNGRVELQAEPEMAAMPRPFEAGP